VAESSGAESGQTEAGRQLGVVFYITVAISVVFVLFGVLFTEPFGAALGALAGGITTGLGWMYMFITAFFLAFAIYLAFSRYGKIRLGKPDEKPEFGRFAWFAMLFQAGMGIGLVFWGVAEPLSHYAEPPLGLEEPRTAGAASLALRTAFFHWCLHPWAMYAVVGLAVAYFSFRRGMNSLKISTVLYPLLGDRVNGPVGKAIDVLAIFATLVGVAGSLGSGTLQIDAGLSQVFGLPSGLGLQLGIIVVTGFAYMLSASTPVEKGVNFLSQASIYLAFFLIAYFLVVGPTLLQLNAFTQETGSYLANIIPQSFYMSAYRPEESAWLGSWTIFFWATWIAWAPYVGAFIARISRGRTIREFIVGVLVAPSLFSMVWFSVFGGAAFQVDDRLNGEISEGAAADPAGALFEFIAQYPFALAASLLAIFLVWIFFVAGADAGTIVLGSMSTGGSLNPKTWVKLTWGVIMAAFAAIMLAAGGLDAIISSQIIAATPFGVLMLAIAYSLFVALRTDYREERKQMQEIMAYDNKVDEGQMKEIMRRREAGEPVGQSTAGRDD
jgi:glycine betaine transporter